MCYISNMVKRVQSSQLNGGTVQDVMSGEITIITYHGKPAVLMVKLPRDPNEVDAYLIVVKEHLEAAAAKRL